MMGRSFGAILREDPSPRLLGAGSSCLTEPGDQLTTDAFVMNGEAFPLAHDQILALNATLVRINPIPSYSAGMGPGKAVEEPLLPRTLRSVHLYVCFSHYAGSLLTIVT